MKKIYEMPEGDWIWDTDTLKWTPPRPKQFKPKQIVLFEEPAKTNAEKHRDWIAWSEFLFRHFCQYRRTPGWEIICSAHDDADKSYFHTLDELLQAGKLEVRNYE